MAETNKGTLLIVDDVPTNLGLLVSYLRGFGFNICVAENGEYALEQIAYAKPDLILLDIMMPDMDGYETCTHLKANEKTREIPVIFMTALSETVDKVKGFKMGAVDYITKPVQREELLARVSTHLTLRNQQKTLEKQKRELEQQNSELEAFVHTVAHDLKNPLNVITGFSNILVEDLGPSIEAEWLEYFRNIKEAGQKMNHTIDALLRLASIRSNDVQMNTLDMAEIVIQVQLRLADMFEKYQGKIITPTIWPSAQGYAPWIEEVWINYIGNGLKYGGESPNLEIGATPDKKGYIRFWILDHGRGLTQEEQNRLFVPFSRISKTRFKEHGLGLSIVQRILEKCGGEVGVESQIGQGSCFYFTLPTA